MSAAKGRNKIKDIFENLSYGPAPESDSVAQSWLEKHHRKFGHFINNEWVHPENRKFYETRNPSNDTALASTTQGTNEDVDLAVAAAKQAYKSWSQTSGHYRSRVIYSIARHVQKHARLLAVIESMDNGKPIRESRDCDVNMVIRHLYHHAGWASLMEKEMGEWKSLGVVGAIVPWNFPLMLMVWKICPALAMGNTVVLKPATFTRLSALLLAEICSEAGLPPGVFNVVTGSGQMGNYLAVHPDVDKVAFTGSTEVGQVLRRSLAGSGKKLSLELGGKSPVVVFESADLESVVEGVVDAIWFNQGQVCCAGSRLLVQESVCDRLVERLKERMNRLRVGDSLDKCIDMAAVVDPAHLQSIRDLVQGAVDEGAQVYQANIKLPDVGCYYPPTIITNVQTSSAVVSQEIFGPVLVILPFRTALEAINIANNTEYGLAASVWTEKVGVALEVAMAIRAGTVWVNCHNVFDSASGFGGYKMSGYGRDGGKEGLFEYVRMKWQDRAPPCTTLTVDGLSKFGASVGGDIPYVANPSSGDTEATTLPKIDRTYKMYYGGAQHRPDSNYSRPIRSFSGSDVIGHVGEGNRKDVRNAVEAAHKALAGWSRRASHNKAQILYYLAENLEIRSQEFTDLLVTLTGVSRSEGEKEVNKSIERLFWWAGYADKWGGGVQETTLYGATIKIHEPVGVVGIVCPPKQHPLLTFVSLCAAAICRSNCVVVVAPESYPLLALSLYQVFDTSDLPAGVVNIITGDADHLTRCLAEHRDIQSIWYHGESAEASMFVEHASADNMKRTWVDWGLARDWMEDEQGCAEDFLHHAVQVKNIWLPMGNIYAN
ncbi:hypothetical protein HELRODRAFT_97056 [Helobdella robusta]|uniref:Aldehyde dehydrogenase domain-containing protein n=1 Tax=Helobdella robusta TaxID=6412 RepID=T1G9F2_HELRO|nr:hypothetical protein HELRODRAFT_97056 [Helobdella robusta]ESO10836.1 hypothetical protein HELRODRAFT_97056 [Helobdella robusta]